MTGNECKRKLKSVISNETLETIYRKYLSLRYDSPITIQMKEAKATFKISNSYELARLKGGGERDIIRDILNNTTKNDIFYDIGAHIGKYTCLMADYLPPDHVVSFEPNPYNLEKLEENILINDCQVIIQNVALANYEGNVDISVQHKEPGANAGLYWNEPELETISVDVRIGEQIVQQPDIPKPTIIKIDVEGAELEVIEGLQNTLSNHQDMRLLYCELHPKILEERGESSKQICSKLRETNFHVELWRDKFIKATKNE